MDTRYMNIRQVFCRRNSWGFLFLVSVLAVSGKPSEEGSKPNIVLLFADDGGYADFGFQDQSDPKFYSVTPNLNRLASEGVRFTNAYVSGAVCSPSRAGMLTGRYQQRFGHEMNLSSDAQNRGLGLPISEKTFANHLGAGGYETACIGKWHLGRQDQYHPNSRGFDYFYGCISGSRSYFPMNPPVEGKKISDSHLQENGEIVDESEQEYFTDTLGDAAIRFIEKNREKPFFLYLSFTAPHGPLDAEKRRSMTNMANSRMSFFEAEIAEFMQQ